ncbi:MAG: SpoIIE family protein phosphatase [Bacteroidota bacterium]|nr:SpoIIE family protein phosphatase [Bacteroidota bacterium]
MTSLLNITQAINDNLPQEDLYTMYKKFLTWELSIEKLALFIRDDKGWVSVVNTNIDKESNLESLPEKFIKYNRLHTIKRDDDPDLQQFEFIIPVYHKKEPIAYSLINGVKNGNDVYNNIQFITSITNIIAVAIENKRLVRKQIIQEKELEFATEVTKMLIPEEMPSGKQFELANIYRPHYKVGGDYIDYIKFAEDKICFCIADVSGKGMAAAMIMANFQALVQNLAQQYKDLETLVIALNQTVLKITKGEKYITFFIALADIKAKRLYYVNAGHIPPTLIKNKKIIELKATCTIIGHFENLPEIKEGIIELNEDVILVAYTDGLVDVKNQNGQNFTPEMLQALILENKKKNANELSECIMNELLEFKGNEDVPDDIAIITFKYYQQ